MSLKKLMFFPRNMSLGHGTPTILPAEPGYDRLRFFLITTDDPHQGQAEFDIAVAIGCRLVFYVAIMTLLLMIVTLIVKLLKSLSEGNSGGAAGRARLATETSRLLPKDVVPFSYGSCEEEDDVESGKSSGNSSGGLYDGKICVICYDRQRNCFFIPCGHCATCYFCAQRITEWETKTCPVCRRYIHKVRKLPVSLE